ncbi:hypothetical protein HPB47_027479 [Ixodes persulcatus]|uniref:Uncharacterized protein n=1 Tax=Ixodes persulcatus TaxID=34615 RepID=A0AC60PX01_IXOPE|nr:hypothetical protein HPB47_027479 [Ixodes persulcatus]
MEIQERKHSPALKELWGLIPSGQSPTTHPVPGQVPSCTDKAIKHSNVRKYLPEVYEHNFEKIKEAVKNRPIFLTIDETPEFRGRPAVAVLVTSYDDKVPGRRTLMADLQVLQQCNAVSIGMFIQEVLQKIAKSLSDVCVLCSDSASYVLHIVNPNVKAELPHMFEIYKHLFALVVQRGHYITCS